jgi:hypothetical protein
MRSWRARRPDRKPSTNCFNPCSTADLTKMLQGLVAQGLASRQPTPPSRSSPASRSPLTLKFRWLRLETSVSVSSGSAGSMGKTSRRIIFWVSCLFNRQDTPSVQAAEERCRESCNRIGRRCRDLRKDEVAAPGSEDCTRGFTLTAQGAPKPKARAGKGQCNTAFTPPVAS